MQKGWIALYSYGAINTWRPRQNGRRSAEDIFKWILQNENISISNNISRKFVHSIALVQIMASRGICGKPLSESMMIYYAYVRHNASMS